MERGKSPAASGGKLRASFLLPKAAGGFSGGADSLGHLDDVDGALRSTAVGKSKQSGGRVVAREGEIDEGASVTLDGLSHLTLN